MEIEQVPALTDNYVYLLHSPSDGLTAAIDPAEAAPVNAALKAKGWKLTHIYCTHHHPDHVGGNLELKAKWKCEIVGFAGDKPRIPGMDRGFKEGDTFPFGGDNVLVMEIPGHTTGHIALYFQKYQLLFCGDTLFSAGCGRLFEGTARQMWDSLTRMRELPAETKVYCAHEYTQSNLKFARSIDPENQALKKFAEGVALLRKQGKPTVPSTIEVERAINPFLRADQSDLQNSLGLSGLDPVQVFTQIRQRKDNFS